MRLRIPARCCCRVLLQGAAGRDSELFRVGAVAGVFRRAAAEPVPQCYLCRFWQARIALREVFWPLCPAHGCERDALSNATKTQAVAVMSTQVAASELPEHLFMRNKLAVLPDGMA